MRQPVQFPTSRKYVKPLSMKHCKCCGKLRRFKYGFYTSLQYAPPELFHLKSFRDGNSPHATLHTRRDLTPHTWPGHYMLHHINGGALHYIHVVVTCDISYMAWSYVHYIHEVVLHYTHGVVACYITYMAWSLHVCVLQWSISSILEITISAKLKPDGMCFLKLSSHF